jgi:REP element-mobilizing transposase RayT
MSHSYSSILFHCVWSTKDRRQTIAAVFRDRLWAYLGGIARENRMKALAVGGTADHAHVLLSLPSTLAVAKAVQRLKGGSSKWVHDTCPEHAGFAWQEGYGAFSIGVSQMEPTAAYIGRQEAHHRRKTFQEEFLGFLEKHGIEYDLRHVWG